MGNFFFLRSLFFFWRELGFFAWFPWDFFIFPKASACFFCADGLFFFFRMRELFLFTLMDCAFSRCFNEFVFSWCLVFFLSHMRAFIFWVYRFSIFQLAGCFFFSYVSVFLFLRQCVFCPWICVCCVSFGSSWSFLLWPMYLFNMVSAFFVHRPTSVLLHCQCVCFVVVVVCVVV